MSSIGAILSIANSALAASQKAVQITSHNISNAGTEGYTLQRVDQVAAHPLYTPHGVLGTGVMLPDIVRSRDALLDTTFRRESGIAAGHGFSRDILSMIETAYGEPSESGLGARMDAFWSAWGELATNPGNDAARTLVHDHGRQVAVTLNQLAASIGTIRDGVQVQLGDSVRRLNGLSERIADLNRQIVSAEIGGGTASDLRDARDLAIDEMATLATIDVIEDPNGAVAVIVAGARVVDLTQSFALEVRDTPDGWAVGFVGRSSTVGEPGGRIGAALDLLNESIPAQRAKLDALAAAIVSAVNEIHREGVNLDGDTDLDFFDPAGVTASSIRVADAIRENPRSIAAGSGDDDGNPLAGANDIALRLAALRSSPHPDLEATVGDFYIGVVTELGVAIQHHTESAEAHTILVSQVDARRASVAGVSIDEELIRLIQFQAAYAAAARLVSAADEMLRTVLEM